MIANVYVFFHVLFQILCCAEIVISGGMSIPQVLTTLDSQVRSGSRISNLPALKVKD